MPTLDELRAQAENCTACPLHLTRSRVVFGSGNTNAGGLLIIGEAPGKDEDNSGFPFVGKAGQVLTRLLHHAGIDREACYITNTVLCRPPENREPTPQEQQACNHFLLEQIETVNPGAIVTVGKTATSRLLGVFGPMSELMKQEHTFNGRILVYPIWHPAYLLRLGTSDRAKQVAKECVEQLKLADKIPF